MSPTPAFTPATPNFATPPLLSRRSTVLIESPTYFHFPPASTSIAGPSSLRVEGSSLLEQGIRNSPAWKRGRVPVRSPVGVGRRRADSFTGLRTGLPTGIGGRYGTGGISPVSEEEDVESARSGTVQGESSSEDEDPRGRPVGLRRGWVRGVERLEWAIRVVRIAGERRRKRKEERETRALFVAVEEDERAEGRVGYGTFGGGGGGVSAEEYSEDEEEAGEVGWARRAIHWVDNLISSIVWNLMALGLSCWLNLGIPVGVVAPALTLFGQHLGVEPKVLVVLHLLGLVPLLPLFALSLTELLHSAAPAATPAHFTLLSTLSLLTLFSPPLPAVRNHDTSLLNILLGLVVFQLFAVNGLAMLVRTLGLGPSTGFDPKKAATARRLAPLLGVAVISLGFAAHLEVPTAGLLILVMGLIFLLTQALSSRPRAIFLNTPRSTAREIPPMPLWLSFPTLLLSGLLILANFLLLSGKLHELSVSGYVITHRLIKESIFLPIILTLLLSEDKVQFALEGAYDVTVQLTVEGAVPILAVLVPVLGSVGGKDLLTESTAWIGLIAGGLAVVGILAVGKRREDAGVGGLALVGAYAVFWIVISKFDAGI